MLTAHLDDGPPQVSFSSPYAVFQPEKEKKGLGLVQNYVQTEMISRQIDLAGVVRDSEVHINEFKWLVREISQNIQPTDKLWPNATRDETKILDYLVTNGRYEVANRLNDLIQMIYEDPEDDETLHPKSLESIAKFFVEYNPPYSPYGSVVAGHSGVLGIEWKLPMSHPPDSQWKNCDGILSMRFLPSGRITYAGEIRQVGDETAFYAMGEDVHAVVFNQVIPFFEQIENS